MFPQWTGRDPIVRQISMGRAAFLTKFWATPAPIPARRATRARKRHARGRHLFSITVNGTAGAALAQTRDEGRHLFTIKCQRGPAPIGRNTCINEEDNTMSRRDNTIIAAGMLH